MISKLCLGTAPKNEEVVAMGRHGTYTDAQRASCTAFIEALRRKHGAEPTRAFLMTEVEHKTHGNVYQVVCRFDTDDTESQEYAKKCLHGGPNDWEEVGMKKPFTKDGPHYLTVQHDCNTKNGDHWGKGHIILETKESVTEGVPNR